MADFVKLDLTDLRTELLFWDTVDQTIRKRVWPTMRRLTFKAIREVKNRMPVDTGRARADWGSHAEFNKAKLETEHGSTLVYVPLLNQGSSTQAPAGFIDAIAFRVAVELTAEMGADVEAEFRD